MKLPFGIGVSHSTKETPQQIVPGKPVIVSYTPSINSKTLTTEDFKGETPPKNNKFDEKLGEPHPFDLSVTEGIYKNFGFVTGVIDKYIDFVVGPGFFVKSENESAKQIIEKFMLDVNFDTWLRAWLKEALMKGTGYMELASTEPSGEPTKLKVLDAKRMFIKRDKKGNITGFSQTVNENSNRTNTSFNRKIIEFKPEEIAELPLNVIGDEVYGFGIIYPAISSIEHLLALQANMGLLMKRKANAPIVAKLGDAEHFPNPSAVRDFGNELEVMTNKTEWAVDFLVDMKVLDFGNLAEKFEIPIKHYEDLLFFTFQVPEVLMGRGKVPEGLAEVQLAAFERRVQSIQAQLEKVIENKIFKRVLNANGLDVHVEFEWGQPSEKETNERIKMITELLKNSLLNFNLRELLEKELALLLGFPVEMIETPEEEREREEDTALPIIPGQNRKEVYLGELVY